MSEAWGKMRPRVADQDYGAQPGERFPHNLSAHDLKTALP